MNIIRRVWDFGDGYTSNDDSPLHTYLSPGVYTVVMTEYGDDGNEYTETKSTYVSVSYNSLDRAIHRTTRCFNLGVDIEELKNEHQSES